MLVVGWIWSCCCSCCCCCSYFGWTALIPHEFAQGRWQTGCRLFSQPYRRDLSRALRFIDGTQNSCAHISACLPCLCARPKYMRTRAHAYVCPHTHAILYKHMQARAQTHTCTHMRAQTRVQTYNVYTRAPTMVNGLIFPAPHR